MVLRSHIRASARPEEIIADQRTVSNSFNRLIRSLVESSSAFASLFRVGSDMNRLIIFRRWSFSEWRVLSLGILKEMKGSSMGRNPNAVEEEDDRHGVVLVFRLFACDLKKHRF